jgi:hypothetical protein
MKSRPKESIIPYGFLGLGRTGGDAFNEHTRASPPLRSYFLNVEHVFEYYWASRAIENSQMSLVFSFTIRCAIPTATGRVYILHCPHVFNDCAMGGSPRSFLMPSAARISIRHMDATEFYIRQMRRDSGV